ncbi:glycosyltransferase [Filomicrobium sp.]|uniref:glycosyltransferase n=1 Tax=Filomicrobium sp. TaxID=2024831 RepID=UPI0025872005|nr:glycosyltransferase [Filomicrobium sp.]MCV0371476.1 glycosyltransferase [Filomicrobium sp.]
MVVALYFYGLSNAGGAERMICQLANALDLRGFTVHLVSWDAEGAQTFYPLRSSVSWHRLGFRPGARDKLRRTRALASVLRKAGARALVGFVMSGDKTVYAAAKLSGVRLIAAERNSPSMYRLRYSALQRRISFASLRLCDRIAVQFKDYMAGYPASLRRRMEVIGNPVGSADTLARPGVSSADGRYTLLAAGRLDPLQKRFDHLVQAFAAIAERHRDWDLRIVGGGPQEDELRKLIREHSLQDRVKLEATTLDIFQAYSEAHLFAIPSLWEGFPNVLAEAMSHGLPAVGYRGADGVAQLIEDGASGWLAEGLHDPQMLAVELSRAMGDASERVRRGSKAGLAMAAYSPEIQYDRWENLIRTCLDGERV